jgi:hypothetical protein
MITLNRMLNQYSNWHERNLAKDHGREPKHASKKKKKSMEVIYLLSSLQHP